MPQVFVYGTLKKGFANHSLLEPYLGEPAQVEGLRLHPGPGYPYASEGEGVVHGELYAVDGPTLKRLDALEEVPTYYQRHRCTAKCASGSHAAWVYVRPQAAHLPVIPNGRWPQGIEQAENKL